EPFPGRAAVFRSIQAAPRPAAGEKPRLSSRLPERGKDNVRVVRIEHDVDAARVLVFAQNFRPCLAAVGRAKNSALLIWTERMAERRDKNDIGILRIDDE